MSLTVRDLVDRVASVAPWWWAEPWDNVGLIAGDEDAPLERVFVSLDPTPEALDRAVDAGAQVLLTHHPPFREGPARLTPAVGLPGVCFSAVARGVALIAAHTNLDRSPEGALALPEKLNLTPGEPLEPGLVEVSVVTVYVPRDAVARVRSSMSEAGAGDIGRYTGCAFTSEGVGTFTPQASAHPTAGTIGVASSEEESRVEMVCARGAVAAVVAACRRSHPYEEPVIIAVQGALALGVARMGRVCEAPKGFDVRTFAADVGRRLGVRPRVWGDPDRAVRTVAVAPGSGRSFVGGALAAGVDVFMTGELRYHDALDAAAAGLAVVEAGHDATEWPLAAALADIARGTPGLDAQGIVMDDAAPRWWVA